LIVTNIVAGWLRVRDAARFASVSERTLRKWLRSGLRHARLPSGRILIRVVDIDIWLENFCEVENRADQLVGEILREVHGKQ
jgi:predicted site-specific integrase-resolvase